MKEEIDDFELEISFNELDAIQKEMEVIDEGFEWCELMSYVEDDLQLFITNMKSLSLSFDAISKSKKDNSFLLGILWSGVLSAYEGFVHNLFDRLLQKNSFQIFAISRLNNLNEKDKKHLKINSKTVTKDCLEKLFRRATLHDPNQTVRLLKQLFGIEIPEIDEDVVQLSLKIRNSYTHNNGFVDGKKIEINIHSLISFHDKIDFIISHYANKLIEHADTFIKIDLQHT